MTNKFKIKIHINNSNHIDFKDNPIIGLKEIAKNKTVKKAEGKKHRINCMNHKWIQTKSNLANV
jgi:hypothetical protein